MLKNSGATLKKVDLQYSTPADAVMEITLAAETAASFDHLLGPNLPEQLISDRWSAYIKASRLVSAVDYLQVCSSVVMRPRETAGYAQA